MKPTLPRRVQNLEERLPLKRTGGPMIVVLEAGEDAQGPFQPWYDHRGQPREPIWIVLDTREAQNPSTSDVLPDNFDYGDDAEDELE